MMIKQTSLIAVSAIAAFTLIELTALITDSDRVLSVLGRRDGVSLTTEKKMLDKCVSE